MPSENDRIYARWKKLVARAADSTSTAQERTTARKAAEEAVEDHPWIRKRHEQESRQGRPEASSGSAASAASATSAWLRSVVEDVARAAREEAASQAPEIAREFTRRTIDNLKDKLMPPAPDRLTTQALIDELIVSGRTIDNGDEDADGHDDQVVVVLVLPADATDALCKRYEDGEGTNAIVSRVGKLVMSALADTYKYGEAGHDWPFDDGEEGEEEEDE